MEVQEVILQGISRDEAALAIAQKVFKRLYENTTSDVHVSVHLAILESIRDVCKRVVKELTSWVRDQLLLLGFRVKLERALNMLLPNSFFDFVRAIPGFHLLYNNSSRADCEHVLTNIFFC
jgi:hypothetical protein